MGFGCNSYQASKTISPEKAVEITNECVMIKEEFGLDSIMITMSLNLVIYMKVLN